jgi:hypothetical protein
MSRTWAYTLRDGAVHGEIFEDAAAVPHGWADSPALVGAAVAVAVADDKDALIAQAEALGLDVDRRFGMSRLRAMIAEASA